MQELYVNVLNSINSLEKLGVIERIKDPKDKRVQKFFEQLGKTIEIKDEKISKNFWSSGIIYNTFF